MINELRERINSLINIRSKELEKLLSKQREIIKDDPSAHKYKIRSIQDESIRLQAQIEAYRKCLHEAREIEKQVDKFERKGRL